MCILDLNKDYYDYIYSYNLIMITLKINMVKTQDYYSQTTIV